MVGLVPSTTAAEPFEPGSVQSRGRSLRVGGYIGGTEYSLNLGTALARAQGSQGNAQAQAIDLGLFGLILSQPTGCGGAPPLPREQQPAPIRVNSVGGNHSDTNRVSDYQLVRGGTEFVAATTKPSATARTRVGQVDLAPVIAFDGIDSTADSAIDATKKLRESVAATTVSTIDIAGGIVRIKGLRWRVGRTTGATSADEGAFTVEGVEVGGISLPTETPAQIADAFVSLNGVLATLGLVIEPPDLVQHDDGTLEVTPLVVNVGGNDQANVLVGPLLDALQPLRDELYAFIHSSGGCPLDPGQLDGLLLVADVLLAGVTGSGGFRVEVGGARTLHDTQVFDSSLGDIPPLVPFPGVPGIPSSVIGGESATGGGPRIEAQPGDAGRASTRCATTHPSGSPGCSKGSAVLAGTLSLIVGVVLLGAETYRSRRREGKST